MATGELPAQALGTGRIPSGTREDSLAREDRWLARAVGMAAPALLLAVALGLRLPYLMEVPGFTDEDIDVMVGLDALHGRWPLVDAEPYIGSLFNYLIAAGFLLLGHHGYVPRLVVTLLGALTVVLTYLLARRLAGATAALVAAGLMATSGVHIVDGHIAWSNCTTPFFTTAAMLALVEAVARRSGPLLVGAGGLYGLALQTHVSVLFLAPALVLHFLFGTQNSGPGTRNSGLGTRHPLLSPWPYLAVGAALIAYGNVIAYNLLNPGAWERAAREKEYAFVAEPSPDSYIHSLQDLAAALVRMAAGSFGGGPSLSEQLATPVNLPYLAAVAAGVGYALLRRQLLPVAGVAGTALLMPYLNRNYDFPIGVRYLGFLLPLLYLLAALPLSHALDAARRLGRPAGLVLGAATLLLVALPAANLFAYHEGYLRLGATSPTILALEEEVRERYRAGIISEVLLDPQLDWVYTAPGGRALRAFDLLLQVEGVPHRTVWMVPQQVKAETQGARRPVVLVISAASRQRLGERFGLVPMEVPDRAYLRRDGYWAYSYLPAGQ